ncbi:MAG: type II toxin-antitoxin system RatA family toxin [Burkholderiaceae bacterium]|jgi:ribosome-associated toxin RatA of RatAB toxin-antitoxin module
MAVVKKTVLVPFSAEQMFDLVQDVPAYPAFLPWCGGARITAQTTASMDAAIDIAFKGIRQTFATHNVFERPLRIDMQFREGPFRKFQGQWRFTALRADASKIDFTLEYEFSSGMLTAVIGPVFNYIANTFVDGFVKRAEALFATPPGLL